MIHAFLINLPEAKIRLTRASECLQKAGIAFSVVKAVRGSNLQYPVAGFSERLYKIFQGRRRIDAEVGCYFSHLKALSIFLKTDYPFGLILEDDAQFDPGLGNVLERAISHSNKWDILRLSTVNRERWTKTISLDDHYFLGVAFTREKGSGGYLVSRKAARKMLYKYSPMFLPYDQRFDLEWFDGLRSLGITPAPVTQFGFTTQIQANKRSYYLSPYIRYWTVFPFRALCETTRVLFRSILWINMKIGKNKTVPRDCQGKKTPGTLQNISPHPAKKQRQFQQLRRKRTCDPVATPNSFRSNSTLL